MAEAFAAISIACNIIQLVDYGRQAVSVCREIYANGEDVKTSELKETTEALRGALAEWRPPPASIRVRNLATTSRACFNVASELKKELDEIAITGKRTLSKVLGASFKSMRKASHIQKLKGQLKEYQDVMNTQILVQLSKQISDLENKQDQALSQQASHLQTLLQQLRQNDKSVIDSIKNLNIEIAQHVETQHSTTRTHTEKVVKTGMKNLEKSNKNEHVQTRYHTETVLTNKLHDFRIKQDVVARQQKMLRSLVVPEMLQRQESSKLSPHKQTCEWIFKPGAAKEKGWDDFVEWLEHGKSTYWISGKPGAGKSTLVSFLIHEGKDRIASHLQSRSSSSECYVLSAFIFESGTELGRNALGLLRTLLWQLLKLNLERDGSLFSVVESIAPGSVDSVWTEEQLWSSLTAAFSATEAAICLFLDGLDEFEDEFWLLQFLKDLEQFSNLRICVSSRPEIVLSNALQHNPKLKLQDLTKEAIERVIGERLIKPLSLDPEASESLRNSMTERAEGVFLWVDLAIKDLYAGHFKGASLEDLQRRLDDLPPGLFNLYTRMLQRNNREMDIYRSEAEQYLRLIYAAGPLTLLQVKIALTRSLQDSFLLPESIWDYAEICRLNLEPLATQIRARCAGLLEVHPTPSDSFLTDSFLTTSVHIDDDFVPEPGLPSGLSPAAIKTATKLKALSSQTVQFIHRSVMDYLRTSHQGMSIIGSKPATLLQEELENANRARLVSIIALGDVECLARAGWVFLVVSSWLTELCSDHSTLGLALLAFNKLLLGQQFEFQSELQLRIPMYGAELPSQYGDSQYGINFPLEFVDWRIPQLVSDYIKAHGQKLDTYDELSRQLLLFITERCTISFFTPSLEELSKLLLTTCADLDTPHYSLFSPGRTISIRERAFLTVICSDERYEATGEFARSKIDCGLTGRLTVEPRFTEVCGRGRGSQLHFRYIVDDGVTRVQTVRDLLRSEGFEFSLLWDQDEETWYDISTTNISDFMDLLDEGCLDIDRYSSHMPGSICDAKDIKEHYGHMHQHLKKSGRKVECAERIAQILHWPPLTTDELIDLEMILLSHEPDPDSDVFGLHERMALRLQGLKPEPLIPAPEFVEWLVETYAPERYKPVLRKD